MDKSPSVKSLNTDFGSVRSLNTDFGKRSQRTIYPSDNESTQSFETVSLEDQTAYVGNASGARALADKATAARVAAGAEHQRKIRDKEQKKAIKKRSKEVEKKKGWRNLWGLIGGRNTRRRKRRKTRRKTRRRRRR
jgi:hypothetical protein